MAPSGHLPVRNFKAMEVGFCDVYELRGNKILRADSYFDSYELVNQLL